MTPESVSGLRITAADIAPIWQAIAGLRSGGRLTAVPSPPREPTESGLPAHLAA
jgi:hypothetical protein